MYMYMYVTKFAKRGNFPTCTFCTFNCRWMDGSIVQCIHEWMDGWMYITVYTVHPWMDGCILQCIQYIHGWMNVHVYYSVYSTSSNGWMDV